MRPAACGSEPLHGVIGCRCSGASMAVARIAGLEHVPQISASSTSPKLSNTDDFPYFFRTVAPDGPAGTLGALIQLFREFDWVRHNHADAITAALLDPSLPQHQLIAAAVLAGYADNFAHRQGLGEQHGHRVCWALGRDSRRSRWCPGMDGQHRVSA